MRVLNSNFLNQWTERDGITPWSPLSSDITLLDFILQRHTKDKHVSSSVPGTETLRARNNGCSSYGGKRDGGDHVARNLASLIVSLHKKMEHMLQCRDKVSENFFCAEVKMYNAKSQARI